MRLIETDSLSNRAIDTATTPIGAYTATATRGIIVRLFADQVAGNGDYTPYITLQLAGTGSAYRIIPVTTGAAASGLTAIGFISAVIPVDSGDVLAVYLLGLAGDTTTPDTRCDFYEQDYLRPTTAGRTLDVSATGEAGVDWGNVGSPTTTLNLSGTTVGVAAALGTQAKADVTAAVPAQIPPPIVL